MMFTFLVAYTLFAGKNHVDLWKNNKFAKAELPNSENNFKKYNPGAKSLKMSTVIYAGFESILVHYITCDKKNETNKILIKHVPCGYSINVVNSHKNSSKQTHYCGDNAVSKLCKEIRAVGYRKINFSKSEIVELTLREQKEYEDAKYCRICKKVFGDKKKHRKVRDHCHYSGKYRGAAHSICNLRYSTQKDIPVLFHNGSNYDFNLIIKELAEEFKSELQCIPVNTNHSCFFPFLLRRKYMLTLKTQRKSYLPTI